MRLLLVRVELTFVLFINGLGIMWMCVSRYSAVVVLLLFVHFSSKYEGMNPGPSAEVLMCFSTMSLLKKA